MDAKLDAQSASPLGIIRCDSAGTIEGCNRTAEQLLGVCAAELLGQPVEQVLPEWRSWRLQEGGNEVVWEPALPHCPPRPLAVSWSDIPGEGARGTVILFRDLRPQRRRLGCEHRELVGRVMKKVSHDTRNVLYSLQLGLQLLERSLADRPEAAEVIETLKEDQARLPKMLEHIRDFSREIELEPQQCDLRVVFRDAWQSLQPQWAPKQLRLREPDVDFIIHADDRQLRRAIKCVLENAIDASPEGGEIRITASENSDQHCRIMIDDQGPGIPRDARNCIFEPFYSTRAKCGLGLPTARAIVEAHGGEIWAAPNEGSGEIVIDLPKTAPVESAEDRSNGRTSEDSPSAAVARDEDNDE